MPRVLIDKDKLIELARDYLNEHWDEFNDQPACNCICDRCGYKKCPDAPKNIDEEDIIASLLAYDGVMGRFVEKLQVHYDHARQKHPTLGRYYGKNQLLADRYLYEAMKIKNDDCPTDEIASVLFEEVYELLEQFYLGNYKLAEEEAADVAAVLIRMLDKMREQCAKQVRIGR